MAEIERMVIEENHRAPRRLGHQGLARARKTVALHHLPQAGKLGRQDLTASPRSGRPPADAPQANCSTSNRSSSPCPGSNRMRWRTAGSDRISTDTTFGTDRLSASASPAASPGPALQPHHRRFRQQRPRQRRGRKRRHRRQRQHVPSRWAKSDHAPNSCTRWSRGRAQQRAVADQLIQPQTARPHGWQASPPAAPPEEATLVDRQRRTTRPSDVVARISSGLITVSSAAASRSGRSSAWKVFIMNPTVPQFMP